MIVFVKIIKVAFIFTLFSKCVTSWKTCDQTFCHKVRKSPEGYPRYSLDLENLTIDSWNVLGSLITDEPSETLKFTLTAREIFTIQIEEISPTMPRKRVITIPADQSQSPPLKVQEVTSNTVTLEVGKLKAIIYGKPFKVEFYSYDKLVSIINPRDRLVFEFDGINTTIAMDVSFIGAQRAYGIPLHAEHLPLQNTGPGGLDPYRLFNVNNDNYKIKSTEALHGAVPVLYGHGTKQSSGIFWYNTAQTWVDITTTADQIDAFFMSESRDGLESLALMVLPGPTLAEATQQITLAAPPFLLPQYFALGYHQSRQSYMTQDEVLNVVEEFDNNYLPLDAVWLDFDYTENKKQFTWDPDRFPNPLELQAQLAASNRQLVAVIDPQVKAEKGYFIHDEATAKGYYVRNPNGTDYLGLGRAGLSGYWDFLNPDALLYYWNLHGIDSFKGDNIHIWNDMNEPTVLDNNEHENTLPGGLLHNPTKWQHHRDVHNYYGFVQTSATFGAYIQNHQNARPFTLTRSHFFGAQTYAAVWTGDNYASWEHLEISFPMCLAEALVGISFCGANVGGFKGIPDDELYQRWYQAGAWLPFYRGHSTKDVPRREPYMYSKNIQSRIRTALHQRYAHLPIWYTLFWEYNRRGEPVIRPITYHYPSDLNALDIDNEILIGANILAAPVLQKGAFIVSVYLPGGESEIWYNIDDNYKVMVGTGYQLLYVNISSVPVFYRGGSIIPRKDIPRPSTAADQDDPYTLYICLDRNNQANGTLYVDDYKSYNYAFLKQYLYLGFSFTNNAFSAYKIDPDADYDGAASIGQIIILRPPKDIAGVKWISNSSDEVKITYSEDKSTLTISNILLNLREPFKFELY